MKHEDCQKSPCPGQFQGHEEYLQVTVKVDLHKHLCPRMFTFQFSSAFESLKLFSVVLLFLLKMVVLLRCYISPSSRHSFELRFTEFLLSDVCYPC